MRLRDRAWAGMRRATRPTLFRRLMLAQVGLLVVMWTGLMAFTILDTQGSNDLLDNDAIYHAIFSVADNLADRPERQQDSLARIVDALQDVPAGTRDGAGTPHGATGDHAAPFLIGLLVWQNDTLVYRSTTRLPPLRPTQMDARTSHQSDGHTYRLRTLRSPQSGTEVTLVVPDVAEHVLTFHSRGFYLVPLLISLPFLILPAGYSVYRVLRPWNRLSQEIAARDPADMRPLTVAAKVRELQPFIESINVLLTRVRSSALRERMLIADAAHELRTPLAAMRVNAEALHDRAADPDQRALLRALVRSNLRASRMVNQLLQLSRNEGMTESTSLQRLRLDTLVQDRLAVLYPLAQHHAVELELIVRDAPLDIDGDRESLISLIDNLVDNAVKYSPRGGKVTVGIARNDVGVCLDINDEGPGIPAEQRERVFDRFYRCPDTEQIGSGLGLAIVRSVLTKHGASITLATGDQGKGLAVRVAFADPGLQDVPS